MIHKLVSITLLAAGIAAGAQTTQPDIGATVTQLEARYGKINKVEPGWCGGTAYGFMPCQTAYIYAIVAPGDSVVSDVSYVKIKGTYGVGLWDKEYQGEMKMLFDQNKSNATWEIHTQYVNNWLMWKHSNVFKKTYWLEYPAFSGGDGLTANIGNKSNMFQIRTLAQLKREEKFAKTLQAEAKSHVTVGQVYKVK